MLNGDFVFVWICGGVRLSGDWKVNGIWGLLLGGLVNFMVSLEEFVGFIFGNCVLFNVLIVVCVWECLLKWINLVLWFIEFLFLRIFDVIILLYFWKSIFSFFLFIVFGSLLMYRLVFFMLLDEGWV